MTRWELLGRNDRTVCERQFVWEPSRQSAVAGNWWASTDFVDISYSFPVHSSSVELELAYACWGRLAYEHPDGFYSTHFYLYVLLATFSPTSCPVARYITSTTVYAGAITFHSPKIFKVLSALSPKAFFACRPCSKLPSDMHATPSDRNKDT